MNFSGNKSRARMVGDNSMVNYFPAARAIASPAPSEAEPQTRVMFNDRSRAEFERLFLPHLDAAYNLARLLTRNAQDAEDVVQESYLRALRAFATFRGDAGRPWLLTIVRNTCFTWLGR